MFPNFRLMIVTVLAAILGIGCGLGLFATFRVNHEPLARLSDGGAPLQLAWEKVTLAPRPSNLGVGYPVASTAGPQIRADAEAAPPRLRQKPIQKRTSPSHRQRSRPSRRLSRHPPPLRRLRK